MSKAGSLSLSSRVCAWLEVLEMALCASKRTQRAACARLETALASTSSSLRLLTSCCAAASGLQEAVKATATIRERAIDCSERGRPIEGERSERRARARATSPLAPLVSFLLGPRTANAVARSEWCGGGRLDVYKAGSKEESRRRRGSCEATTKRAGGKGSNDNVRRDDQKRGHSEARERRPQGREEEGGGRGKKELDHLLLGDEALVRLDHLALHVGHDGSMVGVAHAELALALGHASELGGVCRRKKARKEGRRGGSDDGA